MAENPQADPVTDNRARLLALLGAIASGIGVVGFVTVVGGMVIWIRFDALHLPADKAVASIPRTDLVVIGLSTLIPFIALGLLAVFLAYVFAANNLVPSRTWEDLGTRWSGGEFGVDVGPVAAPSPAAVSASPGNVSPWEAKLAALAREASDAAAAAQAAAKVGRTRVVSELAGRIAALRAAVDEEFQWLAELPDSSPPELLGARAHLKTIDAAEQQATAVASEASERRTRTVVTLVVSVVGLVVFELAIVFATGTPPFFPQLIGLVAIGLVLAAIALVVGWRTQGFALFGAAIFISVLLFGTARTLWRTYHAPKVQPAAALRSGRDAGLTGYFIAETSDRVYLARILGTKKPKRGFRASMPRLVVIPRTNVVAMEVGPLQSQNTAYNTSYQLLQELCAQKVVEQGQQPTSKVGAAAVIRCGQQH